MKTYLMNCSRVLVLSILTFVSLCCQAQKENGLVGHWKLKGDSKDYSGNNNHGINHGVKLDDGVFPGNGSYIEVPNSPSLNLGTGDFSFSVWVHTDTGLLDIVGDVL